MLTPEPVCNETTTSHGWFKTTLWTVVLAAGRGDSPQSSAALAKLCAVYWHPLYSYIRRSGHRPEDAQDLTREFFARLIAKDYLEAVDREKGKFRSFLLIALKRFLANEWDRANRLKRGGGRHIVSLDETEAEARYQAGLVDNNTPEKVFDQRWASALLEQVLNCLAREMAAQGKEKLFQELKPLLSGEAGGNSYSETAFRLGMSEGTLRVNIHRLRQRYRELLRAEVAQTVDSPEAIDDEIRHLFAAVG
jgi:RNA polymerase sigma-70 factor (ECF subfamily)